MAPEARQTPGVDDMGFGPQSGSTSAPPTALAPRASSAPCISGAGGPSKPKYRPMRRCRRPVRRCGFVARRWHVRAKKAKEGLRHRVFGQWHLARCLGRNGFKGRGPGPPATRFRILITPDGSAGPRGTGGGSRPKAGATPLSFTCLPLGAPGNDIQGDQGVRGASQPVHGPS